MRTCGTCVHFGALINDDQCNADKRYHICDLIKHLNAGRIRDPQPTAPAGAVDGSGYFAALCVSEEFGCNQHTEKL